MQENEVVLLRQAGFLNMIFGEWSLEGKSSFSYLSFFGTGINFLFNCLIAFENAGYYSFYGLWLLMYSVDIFYSSCAIFDNDFGTEFGVSWSIF